MMELRELDQMVEANKDFIGPDLCNHYYSDGYHRAELFGRYDTPVDIRIALREDKKECNG